MTRIAVLVAALTLAACGADGPPVRPSVETSVKVGSGGVTTSTTATIRKGPFAILMDL